MLNQPPASPQPGVHVRQCRVCDDQFTTRHVGQDFCSVRCKRAGQPAPPPRLA